MIDKRQIQIWVDGYKLSLQTLLFERIVSLITRVPWKELYSQFA